jgi:hypothetical protein
MGAVAKSYMMEGFLIYEEIHKYLVIHTYMRRPLVIYAFAPATVYMRKILFSVFLSVQCFSVIL